MASLTKVMILFCGQGMTSLVEVYNDGIDTHAPDHLVLVDCGGNQRWAEHAVGYIMGKLNEQGSAGKTPKFDAVVISHQDGDHLTLLRNLTEEMQKSSHTFECGIFFAGGANWSATNKKTVTKFAQELDVEDDIEFESPYQSDYSDVTKYEDLGHICSFGDVFVRVLISGLKISSGGEDIIRNASSAVVVIENGAQSMILPGDATYQTMAKINKIMGSASGALLPQREGFEVPHHGALRTAVENYDAQKYSKDFGWKIITNFSKYMYPKRVMASAGPRNTHCHPVYEVLVVFKGNLLSVPSHYYVAYIFDQDKATKHDGWFQFTATDALHTTVLQIGSTVLFGNLEVRLTKPGLPPEQVVRFHPIGTVESLFGEESDGFGAAPWASELIYAPAPG
jgi:hypothetical protein